MEEATEEAEIAVGELVGDAAAGDVVEAAAEDAAAAGVDAALELPAAVLGQT